jgi:HD superfamily phosphohydrolase
MNPPLLLLSIRDSVHGTIRLSEEEKAIIEHPLFFRLHHIRQNGLLYFIFPSATHTRFEHSLGVLHIVDQVFWSLLRNSIGATRKRAVAPSLGEAAMNQAISFDEIEDTLKADLNRLARLAALVHDLGHGPFSHTFDAFAPKIEQIIQFIETDPSLASIQAIIPLLRKETATRKRIEHEQMSCVFFASICNEITSDDGHNFVAQELPSLIAAIILGKPSLIANEVIKPYIPLLHDLLASAPVDADRMDYLERDSRSIGVSYGLYDRDRLMKSFLVYKGKFEGEEGHLLDKAYRLGIKFSGIRAVENFIQARFELFVQIYYHKTNSAIQLMLEEIASLESERETEIFSVGTFSELIEIYVSLSDTRFLRILQNQDEQYRLSGVPDATSTIQLANRIATRKLWKRVYEGKPAEAEAVKKHLASKGLDASTRVEKFHAKATKDLGNGAALLHRIGDGIYTNVAGGGNNWVTFSPMIKALAEEEGAITRIYYFGDDPNMSADLQREARVFISTTNQQIS